VKYSVIKKLSKYPDNWPELYMDYRQLTKGGFMNTQEEMEHRLWDFIDELDSAAERSLTEKLLAEDRDWQSKYRELLNMHQSLIGSDLEAPSMRFTKNVMEEISRHQIAPATKSYINKYIIRGISAFFFLMIGGFFVYLLGQIKWSEPTTSSSSVSQYGQLLQDHLTKFNWGKVLSSPYMSVFMMINVILALVLLDMYLQRKKTQPNP
jgi:hypothetical protein